MMIEAFGWMVGSGGFEPPTPTMSRWCSTPELRAYYVIRRVSLLREVAKSIDAPTHGQGENRQQYIRDI